MNKSFKPLATVIIALAASASLPAVANDFPTIERVNYVLECMRDHPGPQFEMSSKCSCALDALAREVSFEDYRSMHTASLANTIGGERGGYYRGKHWRGEVRKYQELQAKAKKGCFIDTSAASR
ncbi:MULTISPECIES: hypothetical protein [unclassified Thauera]|uniref:hypothetical protein n=1 Tax=unclassified Thauera TaxID=2609274 RepID=UPI0002CEACA8|nr:MULTISPECIES: hypothetical protein [unclassified Thauera]ENO75807.1 hypothetical protein B447_18979 [Thauera sp. 27]ENO94579.1 hypothetical protein C662_00080 [Thauera sp. 28]WBL65504.1 hypothetical protein LQF09_06715 [Thauera sp. WB-2]HAG77100.1 hypothetical protein [Thauera sp.]HNR60568.1 hypothetical protein [Thauera sp.]